MVASFWRFFGLGVALFFSAPLFWSYCYADGLSTFPRYRFDQTDDDKYVVLEASFADLNADAEREIFDKLAQKLTILLAELRTQIMGAGQSEPYSPEQLRLIEKEVTEAILEMYKSQADEEAEYEKRLAAEAEENRKPYPRAAYYGIADSFGLEKSWGKPTGYFVTVSLRALRKKYEEIKGRRARREAAATAELTDVAEGAARAMKSVTGAAVQATSIGGDAQIGFVVVPNLVRLIPKDPSDPNLEPIEKIRLDFEPIVLPYKDLKFGFSASTTGGIGLSFGAIWGDIKWAYEFKGILAAWSASADFDLSFGKDNDAFVNRYLNHVGFNAKLGCINNLSIERQFYSYVPYCDFPFVSVRRQKRAVDMEQSARMPFFDWKLPVKGALETEARLNAGAAATGEAVVRLVLSIFSVTEEKEVQKILDGLSFIIDEDPTARIDPQDLDEETRLKIRDIILQEPFSRSFAPD